MLIAFSGSRSLTSTQAQKLQGELLKIPDTYGRVIWHVGDCRGVDREVRHAAERLAAGLVVYRVTGQQRWAFAKRSREMVDAVRSEALALVAFPSRPCPPDLTPHNCDRWQGAGTWGTVAYAVRRGLTVDVRSLSDDLVLPSWLNTQQMTLW